MKRTIRPEDIRIIPPAVARRLTTAQLGHLRRDLGWIPPMAGADPNGPQPLGVSVSGTQITVDDYVNPPTRIPAIVRAFTAANEGYWIEDVFNVPGFTVQGGAIIYTETFPEDHFLADEGRPAPRAPGSEAIKLSAGRRGVLVSRPESWAGDIEVTDEDRRWNRVIGIQDQFRKAGNTFADLLQTSGEEVLDAFVQASGRFAVTPPGYDWAAADPVENTTSTDPRPSAEFARVRRLFVQDKTGVRPDTLIAAPEDLEHLDRIYGDKLPALLQRHNLTVHESVRRDPGKRLYVKSKQVGTLAFDKPLDQEYSRVGTRKTDVYTLDVAPVWVANGADALMEVRSS